jgi:urea carboxylase
MRFRDRHQDPGATDLEYAARINAKPSVEDFIAAHFGRSLVRLHGGFVAGLPFLYQMIDQPRQLEVPKYLRRAPTRPKLTVGYGGCFTAI